MNGPKTTERINKARVEKVKAYVSTHYVDDLRLAFLAEMVNVAPTTLCHIFKQQTSMCLFDYIIGVRIREAAHKLLHTDMDVKNVCYECGFSTLTNFNRQFKKLLGCTPTEFRERS